jgi:hypothetical protein
LTVALTPSTLFSARTTRPAQEAQVMPVMASSISVTTAVSVLISSPVSDRAAGRAGRPLTACPAWSRPVSSR